MARTQLKGGTVRCPSCGRRFLNATRVAQHMNQPTSACMAWQFNNTRTSRTSRMTQPRRPAPAPPQEDLRSDNDVDAPVFEFKADEMDPGGHDGDMDKGAGESQREVGHGEEIEWFEGVGKTFGVGETFMDSFDGDLHAGERGDNLFYPFASGDEWEKAAWLVRSGLSMSKIDEYLSLRMTKTNPLSFRTAKELRSRIEILPAGPRWKFQDLTSEYPTKRPLCIFYRDPIECLQAILSHPPFAKHIGFVPRKVFGCAARLSRVYSSWLSGDRAWDLQKSLPPEASLLGIILSSDKTQITNMTGDRAAHPLLLSLANLDGDIRNKTSANAYLLIALLPVAKFTHKNTRIQGVLRDRLLHQSLDLVLEPLKIAAKIGIMLNDPAGQLRYFFTPLVARYTSPADLELFFESCKAPRLNGVFAPFWRDWTNADPCLFLLPELLHHLHKFFWDHERRWCITVVGATELDYRFSLLQTCSGYRGFGEGISNIKKATGRDHRHAQRYLIGIIAGAVPTTFLTALSALMDFRYLAQAPRYTEADVQCVDRALSQFHAHKHAIIGAQARAGKKGAIENWHIPKLELLQGVVPAIRSHGALTYWSADVTEHAHITVVKDPARSGNNHDSSPQICRYLDRQDKCNRFDIATRVREKEEELSYDDESDEVDEVEGGDRKPLNYFDRARALMRGEHPDAPQPFRTLATPITALHLTYSPTLTNMTVNKTADTFGLRDLRPALADYLSRVQDGVTYHGIGGRRKAHAGCHLPFERIQVWCKLRLQLHSFHYPDLVEPSQAVNAFPPSRVWPYGKYDSVIINVNPEFNWPDSGLEGHLVAHLRVIFRPITSLRHSDTYLAYVERLNVASVDPATRMHILKRALRSNGERTGEVIPLTQIRSPAHLIPRFGRAANSHMTLQTSEEYSTEFFLNRYWDKEIFHALYKPA
ncbi:hypothetical protein BV22DRAFT_1024408 [Leucogyrophana mollusca]|uniref:Uncharacterized protein n=1 Tax=Leucogyrophana mollusca TaxID=85980 RepID=A0ACB8AYE5_9AGAM|nr:hypothetical protein BV22DRAFT_1024408 [Leucogyrophana mollusca]